MLDVQLKIIWKIEQKRTIIHGTNWEKTDLIDSLILPIILLQFNYILGEWKSDKAIKWLYIPFQTFKCWQIFYSLFLCLFFHGKTVGKIQKWLREFTVNHF